MSRPKLSATATESSWEFMELPGMEKVLRDHAASVAKRYEVDADDLYQEALVDVSVRRDALLKEPALIGYRARRRMVERAETEQAKQRKQESWEQMEEEDEWQY